VLPKLADDLIQESSLQIRTRPGMVASLST